MFEIWHDKNISFNTAKHLRAVGEARGWEAERKREGKNEENDKKKEGMREGVGGEKPDTN